MKNNRCYAFIMVVVLVAMVVWTVFSAHMESNTYNNLTGAKTTWWDTLWVELRIQDAPKSQP